jgi:hypothetical protein
MTDMEAQAISVKYLSDLDLYKEEKPYHLTQVPHLESGEASNLQFSTFDGIVVSDARGHEADFKLGTHSLAFERFPSAVIYDGSDESEVAYMREAIEYARRKFRADRVICLRHTSGCAPTDHKLRHDGVNLGNNSAD